MEQNVIGRIIRGDAGAVAVDFADDMDLEEVAAIMLAVSDWAKLRGYTPGRLAMAYSALEVARRGGHVLQVPERN